MLGTPAAPRLTTERLILRGWDESDLASYAGMMADPETARFITRRGEPLNAAQAWSEVAFFIGHWQLLGTGMFVVEEKDTGTFLGRIGPLAPEGWPGLEIAWGLARHAWGKGYAQEAARATIDWTFENRSVDRIVSIIHPLNVASQKVAARVGERRTEAFFTPFREACEIWELRRGDWARCDR